MISTPDDRGIDLGDLLVLEGGLPADDVDRRIGLAYAIAGIKHRIVAFYLHEVDARGLHQLYGFRSAAQYAASRFGMSRREARDLLVAGGALLELPAIDRAFADGQLCWTKVRELVKVATPEHDLKWLERAQALGTDELALEVRLARPGDPPRNWDDRKGLPEIRLKLEAQMPPDVHAKWECVRRRVQGDTPHPLHAWECLEAAFDALLAHLDELDAGKGKPVSRPRYCVVMREGAGKATEANDPPMAVETDDGPIPLDPATASACACCADHVDPGSLDERSDRRIPEWVKRKVLARDRCRCRACGSRLRLDHHHVIEWSKGGPSEPWNLLILCRKCHALVHMDLLVIEATGDGDWRLLDRHGRDIHGTEVRLGELLPELDREAVRLKLPAREAAPAAPAHARRPHRPEPMSFDDVIGRPRVVADLRQAVEVARRAGEPLGHTLLTGGRGLGKTTIASVVASELGVGLAATCGAHLTDPADLIGLLTGLGQRDVLFIDEIHAMPRSLAEILYEAMDHFRLSLPGGGQGGTACHPHAPHALAPFTLIGATTEPGELPGPFVSRFESQHWLDLYEDRDLAAIVERAAKRLDIGIDSEAAAMLAASARGTPREALRLLRKARQQARAAGASRIDAASAGLALARLGIDGDGLTPLDRAYREVLEGHGPIGLSRAAAMLGVDPRVIQRDCEPHLFRLGLAATTPHGRVGQRSRGPGLTPTAAR